MSTYEVIVGNVGTVYNGTSRQEAQESYDTYVLRSQEDDGRAAGESVTLLCGDEIVQEYAGSLSQTDNGE